jgi:competence ComEA-like helix-hairpin-helix protein
MLSLTRQERQVVLFLSTIALMGLGINFLRKKYSQAEIITYFYQDIGKVDLNRADKAALVAVSGIGEKLAQRILDYRLQNGGFVSLEDLKKIKGMNDYRYEKLKDYLYIK